MKISLFDEDKIFQIRHYLSCVKSLRQYLSLSQEWHRNHFKNVPEKSRQPLNIRFNLRTGTVMFSMATNDDFSVFWLTAASKDLSKPQLTSNGLSQLASCSDS